MKIYNLSRKPVDDIVSLDSLVEVLNLEGR